MMPGELANANGANANGSDTDGADADGADTDGANANGTEMHGFAELCPQPSSTTYSWVIRGGPSSVVTLSVSSWLESSAIISEDGARGDGDQ